MFRERQGTKQTRQAGPAYLEDLDVVRGAVREHVSHTARADPHAARVDQDPAPAAPNTGE